MEDADAAAAAAARIGFPVVLKTAVAAHKSDVGGVVLGLAIGARRAPRRTPSWPAGSGRP